MSATKAYGSADAQAQRPARVTGRGGPQPGMKVAAAALIVAALASAAVVSQRWASARREQVSLAGAPAASDFFASALEGLASQRYARTSHSAGVLDRVRVRGVRGRDVRLGTDRGGDVNLNVDVERNGKLLGREAGLKVPVGKPARLHLALSRTGRLQQLDEDVPGDAFPPDDEAEPLDEEDSSDLGVAKQEVKDAKERVLEDAKRLHDLSDAIAEESHKATNAEDYRAEAEEGEAAAKRRAMDEEQVEKAALQEAKKRADTRAISMEAETLKAKMQTTEARARAQIARVRAAAAEKSAALELEKRKESRAEDEEERALDKYRQAEAEKSAADKEARVLRREEAAQDRHTKTHKKEGAVNMNIKVNVDSPVGGDYASWEERCAAQPELDGCSRQMLAARKKMDKRQVNMNIVVNVRSPTDTVHTAVADANELDGKPAVSSGSDEHNAILPAHEGMPIPP